MKVNLHLSGILQKNRLFYLWNITENRLFKKKTTMARSLELSFMVVVKSLFINRLF